MLVSERKFMTICVVNAPLEEVLGRVTGIVRAQENGAVVVPDVKLPPDEHQQNQQKQKTNLDWFPDYLISAPRGQSGLTVVECPPFETLSRTMRMDSALAQLSPEHEVLTILSNAPNKRDQFHSFSLQRGGGTVRYATSYRRTTKWKWEEGGQLQAFEDREAYCSEDLSERMTRDRLAAYMTRYGVDFQKHIADRDFDLSHLVTGGEIMFHDDTRERTKLGQAEYERALSLRIGAPEPSDEQHAARREMFERNHVKEKMTNRALNALNRLIKKSEVTVEKVFAIYKKFETEWEAEVGPDEDPDRVISHASRMADSVAAMAPQSLELYDRLQKWECCRRLNFRLVQLLPEGEGDNWPTPTQINRIILDEIEKTGATDPRLERAVYAGFVEFCATRAIMIDPEGLIPSTEEAMKAASTAMYDGRW